ncbi:hypothetical protein T03_6653 [Trichinella britovi]|uniref:Uncharacterized protein n=1 Tax=Trichinella britovi TaxID=45882 RepID=A0A0V1CSN8_TRIBR|nr:hypothetical protein T03_6653 [Trichinella britovi]
MSLRTALPGCWETLRKEFEASLDEEERNIAMDRRFIKSKAKARALITKKQPGDEVPSSTRSVEHQLGLLTAC